MHRAIERLKSKIGPDSVEMLFFGGYGVQAGGESYMIPVAGADVAILGLKDAVAPENKQTRTKALGSSVAACGAVVIAILTGFGIEARGIRFVPREAVPRRVEERRR